MYCTSMCVEPRPSGWEWGLGDWGTWLQRYYTPARANTKPRRVRWALRTGVGVSVDVGEGVDRGCRS